MKAGTMKTNQKSSYNYYQRIKKSDYQKSNALRMTKIFLKRGNLVFAEEAYAIYKMHGGKMKLETLKKENRK